MYYDGCQYITWFLKLEIDDDMARSGKGTTDKRNRDVSSDLSTF